MNDCSPPCYVDVITYPFLYHTVDLANVCYLKVGPDQSEFNTDYENIWIQCILLCINLKYCIIILGITTISGDDTFIYIPFWGTGTFS